MANNIKKSAKPAPKKAVGKKATKSRSISLAELQALGHQGTEEAIGKLEAYLLTETNEEKCAHAEMALDECELLYYAPTSAKEEEELLLCTLINRRQRRVDELEEEVEDALFDLEILKVERAVHDKVLANNASNREDWKHILSEDLSLIAEHELQGLRDELAYAEAWVAEAKQMITTERYKNISEHYLDHYDPSFDDEEDDAGDDCCCCDGSCDH